MRWHAPRLHSRVKVCILVEHAPGRTSQRHKRPPNGTLAIVWIVDPQLSQRGRRGGVVVGGTVAAAAAATSQGRHIQRPAAQQRHHISERVSRRLKVI